MRFFGFKASRLREWLTVIAAESRTLTLCQKLGMLAQIAAAALNLGVSRRVWRQRLLRGCYRCDLFDREMKRCRPYSGSKLGCGCYTPFLALSKEPLCWARDNLPPGSVAAWDR